MPEMTKVAAGWYPDPEQIESQRYWDGHKWTDRRAPLPVPTSTSSSQVVSSGVTSGILRALGVVVLIVILIEAFGHIR